MIESRLFFSFSGAVVTVTVDTAVVGSGGKGIDVFIVNKDELANSALDPTARGSTSVLEVAPSKIFSGARPFRLGSRIRFALDLHEAGDTADVAVTMDAVTDVVDFALAALVAKEVALLDDNEDEDGCSMTVGFNDDDVVDDVFPLLVLASFPISFDEEDDDGVARTLALPSDGEKKDE